MSGITQSCPRSSDLKISAGPAMGLLAAVRKQVAADYAEEMQRRRQRHRHSTGSRLELAPSSMAL